MNKAKLIETKHLFKTFRMKRGVVSAIDDLSLSIYAGETLALVGESGSGKTVLTRILMRLYREDSGEIFFQGKSIKRCSVKDMRKLRADMQCIFQDPHASLNPRMSVGKIISEPLDIHQVGSFAKRSQKVLELLSLVGLTADHAQCFPHELSGGQCQRVSIARALALRPKLMICDEPTSALDVSIQAQIINLLKKLQKERGLTYLLISHDLTVVKYLSDRIAVMYFGKLVELASSAELYARPLHPYTQTLLSSALRSDRKSYPLGLIGDIPKSELSPKGCIFCFRCKKAMPICKSKTPVWKKVSPTCGVACHLYQ